MSRIEVHSHTEYSNLRLVDATNKVESLIDKAIEIGLQGIAITEHDCLSGAIRINKYAKKIKEANPDFKVIIGNEIYLCAERNMKQPYYHFILLAKNKDGFKALKELSSRAWMNSYVDRKQERVVTLYSDLQEIINKYPNSLIASTACLGGELSSSILKLTEYEITGQKELAKAEYEHIYQFISFCQSLFGEDFYLEIAPAQSKEQVIVNKRMLSISRAFNIPIVIGSDAHYLSEKERPIHKAYLNSKEGDREVDAFYLYAYLQNDEEEINNLYPSFGEDIHSLFEEFSKNSMTIYDKIEDYDLFHTQQIPSVAVRNYAPKEMPALNEYPNFQEMFTSTDEIERYWANQCWDNLGTALNDDPFNHKEYIMELEEEAEVKKIVGKKLNTSMFSYPIVLQHYIDLIWETGSTIGAGRGSACAALNHWLLGITQLDPIKWSFPFFRYMNRDTNELGDIDIDIAPSKRPLILQKIKEERGRNFYDGIDNLSRKNLGCTLIATFKTETSKSAILTSCRGYRSEEYPEGINSDIGQYLSSLIPSERGFVWPLHDVIYGNPEKDRKPVTPFLQEVEKYNGLVEIALGLEGLISGRSSHASGVILFDEDPYEYACFMKTPKGEIITQFDLHDCEYAGLTKFDFLVTSIQDKIIQTIDFLQGEGLIDPTLSLREAYNTYLHPNVLPLNDEETWKTIQEASSLDLFQLDSDIGRQGAKKVKPNNMIELSATNGLIRLMTAEKGAETWLDKFCRYKDNQEYEKDMMKYNLTEEERNSLKIYLGETRGIGISQEQLMRVLMAKDICNYSLAEANKARRIVSKKKMSEIPNFKEKVYATAKTQNLADYVWDYVVAPGLGYSFSDIHSISYSFIGFQSAYLSTHWNPIYWNTACLIVNSGSLEEDEVIEEEDEDEEKTAKKKSSDYAKIAKAIGATRGKGIKVSLIDINKSSYSFKPDAKKNEILFGLKGANKLNDDIIELIIQGRPYAGIKDFIRRCPVNKTVTISLIKGGAFDNYDFDWAKEICPDCPRQAIMAYYLTTVSDLKKRLTLQNLNGLIQNNILPDTLDRQKRIFILNKYFKDTKKEYNNIPSYYCVNDELFNFLTEHFPEIIDMIENVESYNCIEIKKWEKFYKSEMEVIKQWINQNKEETLLALNTKLFQTSWETYATGNISSWEMESLCFYFHEHELSHINKERYGLFDFNKMPTKPIVETYFRKTIPIYKISKICGTVIAKDDTRASVSLLTDEGVVNVKFTKEYYAMFKSQISEVQANGKKKVIEKGWFGRGTKLMVAGYRREDTFVAKTYKNTGCHTLYKIQEINKSGDIIITNERVKANA